MNYQTQMMTINVQVLESVLYNAEKDIPKIKLTLEFDDQKKYKRFINKIAPTSNEDQDVISGSDSEQSDHQELQKSNDLAIKQQSSTVEEVKYIDQIRKLELSIILKQNYNEEFKKIEKETGVTILIVPQKIKYFGKCQQDIQEAKSQVYDIKKNIIIGSFQKYGRQIFQSQYCHKKLNQCGIKLGKVAQKYYYWFDQSKCDSNKVNDCLQQIFRLKVHLFSPLLINYEYLKRKYNSKYVDALIDTNAKLYEKYIEKQINQDSVEHKVQLNKSRTQVIIHLSILEQSEIIKHQIKRFFQNLIHFFVHYKVQDGQQIQKIKQIQQILNQKDILWNRYQDLLILSFNIKGSIKPNQSLSNISILSTRQKQFAQSLREIFDLNSNCYIECLQDMEQIEEGGDQSNQKEGVTIQYKRHDGVKVFSPIRRKTPLFLKIIQEYVLKPKIEYYHNKSNIYTKQGAKQQLSINDNTNNVSSRINDTTSMLQDQNTQMENLGDQSLINHQLDIGFNKPILGPLKQNLAFKKYSFYLKDQEGDKKYDDDTDQIKMKKTKFSESLSQFLTEATKRKYKPYNVQIPNKFRVKLAEADDIVTVFMKNSDKQYLDKDAINVYLIADSKALSTDGWLLNVSKQQIKDDNYKYSILKGTFEIIKYLKYAQG